VREWGGVTRQRVTCDPRERRKNQEGKNAPIIVRKTKYLFENNAGTTRRFVADQVETWSSGQHLGQPKKTKDANLRRPMRRKKGGAFSTDSTGGIRGPAKIKTARFN